MQLQPDDEFNFLKKKNASFKKASFQSQSLKQFRCSVGTLTIGMAVIVLSVVNMFHIGSDTAMVKVTINKHGETTKIFKPVK